MFGLEGHMPEHYEFDEENVFHATHPHWGILQNQKVLQLTSYILKMPQILLQGD